MTTHYYIRHSEHAGDSLTRYGREEACGLHDQLLDRGLDIARVQAWSADTVRSLTTVALALAPSINDTELTTQIETLVQAGRLLPDQRLRYTRFGNKDAHIRDLYQTAYDAGRTMEFYITESDRFLHHNPSLSTHRTLAAELARRTLWETDRPQLHCAREFFWPNFRAAVLAVKGEIRERDDYIAWYCHKKELNPIARTDIAQVHTRTNDIVLEDDYGTLSCTYHHLQEVAEKGGAQ